MAANYWQSACSLSLVSSGSISRAHAADRARGLSEVQLRQLKAMFIGHIWKLVGQTRLRYRVAATAAIYFHKFYLRNNLSQHDPRLVYVGCVYLASKTEENLANVKTLAHWAKSLWAGWPYDYTHIVEIEMVITIEMDFHLLVYHAYRPLLLYAADSSMPKEMLQDCWAAINDMHRSDVVLMYPPHVLALGCIGYAWALRKHDPAHCARDWDCAAWMESLNIDLNAVFAVAQQLGQLYEEQQATVSEQLATRLLEVAGLGTPA